MRLFLLSLSSLVFLSLASNEKIKVSDFWVPLVDGFEEELKDVEEKLPAFTAKIHHHLQAIGDEDLASIHTEDRDKLQLTVRSFLRSLPAYRDFNFDDASAGESKQVIIQIDKDIDLLAKIQDHIDNYDGRLFFDKGKKVAEPQI